MADDKSYIKLFRRMLGWGWYSDTNTVRVFLHILLRANYEESEYHGQKIGAGECVFGRKAWAKELGLSERQVRTAIEHLKSTNEITIRATNKFSIVTVVKWELWQIEEGKPTKRTTNKKSNERPTNDQQTTTSKESNNSISSSLRSEDIHIYEQYEEEFKKLWKLYPRKQGKEQACKHYIKARKNGTSFDEVVNGIIAYANYLKATDTEMRYTKYGSSFFAEKCWQEEWRVENGADDTRRSNKERGGMAGRDDDGEASTFRFTHSV